MRRRHAIAAALALAVSPVAASAQVADGYDALSQQDIRLARVAEHLLGANGELCRETMPLTGLLLHSSDQYANPPAPWFADGEVAINLVLPGSAADRAGVMAGDALVAIEGVPVSSLAHEGEAPFRDDAFWQIAQDTGELALDLNRRGETRHVVLHPGTGCRALVEILAEPSIIGRSDGRVIQVSYGLASRLTDDQLAVVFAHELAHAVLLHRARLEAAGVQKGFFGEFGRNRRLNRQVEIEADRMSVHLLHNAGYDPEIAVGFWQSEAGQLAGGGTLLRSRIYPSQERRSEIVQEEIDGYLSGIEGFSRPQHLLALRDLPFED